MNVILLGKVENLGALGDVVSVKPGYARNYLIPRGKAAVATPENRVAYEARRAELEKAAAETLAQAQARAQALSDKVVTVASRAGDEGRLFGSIGTRDIADAVTAAGVVVAKHEVRLPAGPLRQVGEYDIEIHLHPDVNAQVKIAVVPEA